MHGMALTRGFTPGMNPSAIAGAWKRWERTARCWARPQPGGTQAANSVSFGQAAAGSGHVLAVISQGTAEVMHDVSPGLGISNKVGRTSRCRDEVAQCN